VTSLAIEKLLPPNLVLADIGCGTGTLTFELARLGKRVIGIDLSRAMIQHAKRLAKQNEIRNVEFRSGDAEKLPLESRSVDAAFCVMVLHFLENPRKAIAELCRVTRPGGSVILIDLIPHEQEWMRTEMTHRWLGFDRPTIQGWLRTAGAEAIDYDLSGSYAGDKTEKNGKRRVEIFIARGRLPTQRRVHPTGK
jgi:ArsR family transcriptional regulator